MEKLKHLNLPIKSLVKFKGNVTSQEQLGMLFDFKDYLNTGIRQKATPKSSSIAKITER
jgi:hypothetical protein